MKSNGKTECVTVLNSKKERNEIRIM